MLEKRQILSRGSLLHSPESVPQRLQGYTDESELNIENKNKYFACMVGQLY
jgi:hypothetical protein